MVERQVQMLEQPRVRSDTCHHGYISLEDDAHIFSSLLCFGCCCLESGRCPRVPSWSVVGNKIFE